MSNTPHSWQRCGDFMPKGFDDQKEKSKLFSHNDKIIRKTWSGTSSILPLRRRFPAVGLEPGITPACVATPVTLPPCLAGRSGFVLEQREGGSPVSTDRPGQAPCELDGVSFQAPLEKQGGQPPALPWAEVIAVRNTLICPAAESLKAAKPIPQPARLI